MIFRPYRKIYLYMEMQIDISILSVESIEWKVLFPAVMVQLSAGCWEKVQFIAQDLWIGYFVTACTVLNWWVDNSVTEGFLSWEVVFLYSITEG